MEKYEKNGGVGGTIIRGEDGALYFLRDEMLEACKVTEPDMVQFCANLLDAVQVAGGEEVQGNGFRMGTGNAAQAHSFLGPFQGSDLTDNVNWKASGTVMCPGTMGLAKFRINPGAQVR
ncbi:hypothetical protein ACGFMM_24915 [Streptomyces sp. NPDC048604]|uniref:hypothetical protein n=1 Tax=Streptomyces sp. NPDC048604 TaxID=3365578 RepID=UPI00372065CB